MLIPIDAINLDAIVEKVGSRNANSHGRNSIAYFNFLFTIFQFP
jgi:hypothetical protein